jgi:hypothetical protein
METVSEFEFSRFIAGYKRPINVDCCQMGGTPIFNYHDKTLGSLSYKQRIASRKKIYDHKYQDTGNTEYRINKEIKAIYSKFSKTVEIIGIDGSLILIKKISGKLEARKTAEEYKAKPYNF